MILKERDPHADAGHRQEAGAAAEIQMAFYLRRAFAEQPGVAVINDLRVPAPGLAGDFAQIDHLLVHRFGLIVVESKSVHGTVAINGRHEWSQTYLGKPRGMPSPIEQARRQADVLRRVLATQFDPLGGGLFARVPIDVVVAVSDGGIIERRSATLPEVCKADAVTGHVEQLIVAKVGGGKRFDGPARQKVAAYLLCLHEPVRGVRGEAPKAPMAAPPTAPIAVPTTPACRSCGSRALHIQYGHSYYFRCIACLANTPIPKGCPACGRPDAHVRKERLNFFKDCPSCGRSTLYYVNATLADLHGPDEER